MFVCSIFLVSFKDTINSLNSSIYLCSMCLSYFYRSLIALGFSTVRLTSLLFILNCFGFIFGWSTNRGSDYDFVWTLSISSSIFAYITSSLFCRSSNFFIWPSSLSIFFWTLLSPSWLSTDMLSWYLITNAGSALLNFFLFCIGVKVRFWLTVSSSSDPF